MKPRLTFTASPARLCFAALLMAVMLFAQWMGLQHRIEHAARANDHQISMHGADQVFSVQGDEYAGDKSHSCTLFDGMALADNIPLLPFSPVLQTSVKVLALWAAHASWDAPFLCHFSSRAPPPA